KTSIFSHPVYLFLRKFSLQDSRGGSVVSELEKPSKSKKVSAIKVVKPSDWDSLPDTDLRYIYSQRQPEKTMHERLKGKGVIVDMASLFKQAG
ncbi:hypothetical protein RNN93_16575, partial [Escherichia coli]|nr:hypothetical protein [Escherichia coli]